MKHYPGKTFLLYHWQIVKFNFLHITHFCLSGLLSDINITDINQIRLVIGINQGFLSFYDVIRQCIIKLNALILNFYLLSVLTPATIAETKRQQR